MNFNHKTDLQLFIKVKHKSLFFTGVVGLNNIKANDYLNVVLQVSNMIYHNYIQLLLLLIIMKVKEIV